MHVGRKCEAVPRDAAVFGNAAGDEAGIGVIAVEDVDEVAGGVVVATERAGAGCFGIDDAGVDKLGIAEQQHEGRYGQDNEPGYVPPLYEALLRGTAQCDFHHPQ